MSSSASLEASAATTSSQSCAAVAAEGLPGRVPGDALEAGVDPHERVVVHARVADREREADRLERPVADLGRQAGRQAALTERRGHAQPIGS